MTWACSGSSAPSAASRAGPSPTSSRRRRRRRGCCKIEVNVGRTGTLNPFAVLEPVKIAGATVKLATLHNEDDIRRKDIREGDTVIVQRAGDVIPQVVGPVLSKRTGKEKVFSMPKRCPRAARRSCGTKGEAAYYCPNRQCPAQRFRLLEHFVGRGAMDIDGIGEQLAYLLMERGLRAGRRATCTGCKERRDELLQIERLGEKSVDNLLASIEESKDRPLAQRADRARHPARRRRSGVGARQPLRQHRRADGRDAPSRSTRSRASGRRSPRASASSSRSKRTARSSRSCARPASTCARNRAARARAR